MTKSIDERPEELFSLPRTIEGMQARIDLLKEECEVIKQQLEEGHGYDQINNPVAYRKWKNKAQAAYGWKKQEIAWLIEQHQIAKNVARTVQPSNPITDMLFKLYTILCSVDDLDAGELAVVEDFRVYLEKQGVLT